MVPAYQIIWGSVRNKELLEIFSSFSCSTIVMVYVPVIATSVSSSIYSRFLMKVKKNVQRFERSILHPGISKRWHWENTLLEISSL